MAQVDPNTLKEPGFGYSDDTGWFYEPSTGDMVFVRGGTEQARFSSSAFTLASGTVPSAAKPGNGGATEQTDKVSLTNAEIKGLAAANKTLVAAPGANKMIEFVRARAVLNYGSEVLTESDDNMLIRYGAGGAHASASIEGTGFIDASADTAIDVQPVSPTAAAVTAFANTALVLDNTGNGEYGGNASNDTTMDIYITYRVHDLS